MGAFGIDTKDAKNALPQKPGKLGGKRNFKRTLRETNEPKSPLENPVGMFLLPGNVKSKTSWVLSCPKYWIGVRIVGHRNRQQTLGGFSQSQPPPTPDIK